MAYFFEYENAVLTVQDACDVAGLDKAKILDPVQLYITVADVSAYINDDIIFGAQEEQKPAELVALPEQIRAGVLVPLLAARLAAGIQSVTSISEGGSTASLTPTYSANVGDYAAVLCRYKRLGFPRKAGAV